MMCYRFWRNRSLFILPPSFSIRSILHSIDLLRWLKSQSSWGWWVKCRSFWRWSGSFEVTLSDLWISILLPLILFLWFNGFMKMMLLILLCIRVTYSSVVSIHSLYYYESWFIARFPINRSISCISFCCVNVDPRWILYGGCDISRKVMFGGFSFMVFVKNLLSMRVRYTMLWLCISNDMRSI